MFNPINTIFNTSKRLVSFGKDYFANRQSGMDARESSKTAAGNQFDKSFIGRLNIPVIKNKVAPVMRNAAESVGDGAAIAGQAAKTFVSKSASGKELRERGRDEAAKGTLRSLGGILTTNSRLNNFSDKALNSKVGKVAMHFPGLRSFSAANRIYENFSDESIFAAASKISMKGADSLYDTADFIDEYDHEGVTLDDVAKDPSKMSAYAVQSISQAAPSIAINVVATIIGGGAGAFVAGGAMEGGSQWQEAKQFGATDSEADLAGTLNGLISGSLEAAGSKFLFKGNPLSSKISSNLSGNVAKEIIKDAGKGGVRKFIESIISEGGTEAAQQYVSNIIAKNIYDEERKLTEGVLESAVVGGLAGGAFHGAGATINAGVDISQKANQVYKDLSPKEKQGGYIKVGSDKVETVDVETKTELENSAEFLRNGTIPEGMTEAKMETNIDKLSEKFDVAQDQSNAKIANRFISIISKTNDGDVSKVGLNMKPVNLGGNTNAPSLKTNTTNPLDVAKLNYNDTSNKSRAAAGDPMAKAVDGESTYRGASEAEWTSIQESGKFQKKPGNELIDNKSGAVIKTKDSDNINTTTSRKLAQVYAKGSSSKGVVIEFKPEAKAKMRHSAKFESSDLQADELMGTDLTLEDVASVTNSDGEVIYKSKTKTKNETSSTETKSNPKYQEKPSHSLKASGYITTDEAYTAALQIPVFKQLSEDGKVFLREMLNNPEALGSYIAGTISYVTNPHETTLAHETFHATMEMAFSAQEQQSALDLAREESGMTEMTDLEAEEFLAQKFGEWFVDRQDTSISARMKRIFARIRDFITRMTLDADKLENLFRTVISEETADAIVGFENKGGIEKARQLFNQNQEVFTTEFLSNAELWKKPTQKRATVEAAINRLKKPIMKDYLTAKLETEFDEENVIDMGEFKRAVLADMLDVSIIASDTYATYGLDNINATVDKAKTYILNTNFNHGKKGHFSNDFDVTTTKDDLMIREAKGTHYVIRKDFSEETMESGVFQTFNNAEDAQDYIDNFSDRKTEQAGMIAHYRAFGETETFNVVEMQSDVFQKGTASLVRDAQQLKEMEIKAAKSSFTKSAENASKSREIGLNALFRYKDRIQQIKLTEQDKVDMDAMLPLEEEARSEYIKKEAKTEYESVMARLDEELAKIEADPKYEDKNMYFNSDSKRLVKDLTPEQKNEIELSKQFLSLKNKNHEQIINHAIRQAAQDGHETIRFATPMTVAYVEGYISEAGIDGDGTSYEFSDMYVGKQIEILGDTDALVTSFDEDGFNAVYNYSNPVNEVNKDEWIDGEVENYRSEFNDIADVRDFQMFMGNKKEYVYETQERIDSMTIKELLENDEFSEVAGKVKEEMVETYEAQFDIKDFLDGLGYSIYEDGDNLYYTEEGDIHSERMSYRSDVDKDTFEVSNIEDDTQRTIAEKYGVNDEGKKGVFYKYLEKKRSDLEMVTDDNGFTWYESKIQPSDRAAVELFQTKKQLAKETELEKLENDNYLGVVELEIRKESLDDNPVRQLAKYANRNQELAEVGGNGKGGIFARRGDEISADLGFAYSEDARAAYESYIVAKDGFIELKESVQETKKKNIVKIKELQKEISLFKQGERHGSKNTKEMIKANQRKVISVINSSALDLRDKAKFISTVKNVQTARNLEVVLPKILERIESLEISAETRVLKSRIMKILKKTKIKKVNGKIKGKFTPAIQKVFDKLYKIGRMTIAEAEARTSAIMMETSKETGSTSLEGSLELEMLEMMQGFDSKTPQELFVIMKSLENLRNTGVASRELQAFNRMTEVNRRVELLLDTLPEVNRRVGDTQKKQTFFKKFSTGLKSFGSWMGLDWDGLMKNMEKKADSNALEDAFSVFENEKEFLSLQKDFTEDLMFNVSNAYGVKNKPGATLKVVNELSEEVVNLGEFENTQGKTENLSYSRDVLIKKWMDFKNEDIKQAYIDSNFYTDEMFAAVEENMTAQDKALANGLLGMYEDHYQTVNEVFERIYAVSLPKRYAYSPIVREGFKTDPEAGIGEFLQSMNAQGGVSASSLKSTVKNNNPIVDTGAVASISDNFSQTNYFAAWAEKVRELSSVFTNNEVKTAIKEEFGKDYYNQITNKIDVFVQNGSKEKLPDMLRIMKNNMLVATLAVKPMVFVKQLTSIMAVMEVISPVEFVSGVTEFFLNPRKNWEMMNNESVILNQRSESFDIHLNENLDANKFKKLKTLNAKMNHLMFNVKFGDKSSGLVSAFALRQSLLKQGMPLDEVILKYEKYIHDTQQSAFKSKVSNAQTSKIMGLFTMYMTSQRQYLQKEITAIKSLFKEGGTKPANIKKVAKTIFIYHFLLPVAFQFIANAGRTDDEAEKDYKRAAILGSLNGILIFRDFADAILRGLFGQFVFDPKIPIYSAVDDVLKAVKKIGMDDVEFEDWVNAGIVTVKTAAGLGAGVPTKVLDNIIEGVGDIKKGQTKEGILNIAGTSDYSQTGQGKNQRLTDRQEEMMDTYDELKELKTSGKKSEMKELLNSLNDEDYKVIQSLKKRFDKESLDDLKETKDIKNIYENLEQLKESGNKDALSDALKVLTDEEYDAIKSLQADKKKSDKKEEKEGTSQFVLSLQGMFVDPGQTITAILTKEDIAKVEGSKVVFQRMGYEPSGKGNFKVGESQEKKREMMAAAGIPESDIKEYKLEHIIPLTVGGKNSDSNLMIVTNSQWKSYTRIDIILGNAVRDGKLSRRKASQLAKDFKNDILTAEQVISSID